MKTNFQHIDHQFKNISEKGFFIFNKFKLELKNPTLEDIISSDLLNEDYFSTEEQKIETQKQLDQLISLAKMRGAYRVDENDIIELYGPLLKVKIQSSDFSKLDYKSYLAKMQFYVIKWTDENWLYLVEGLQEFHQFALKRLENESADKRIYYFLDANLVREDKLYEVNWYEYFFTVVSTLENSDQVVIMNFGND